MIILIFHQSWYWQQFGVISGSSSCCQPTALQFQHIEASAKWLLSHCNQSFTVFIFFFCILIQIFAYVVPEGPVTMSRKQWLDIKLATSLQFNQIRWLQCVSHSLNEFRWIYCLQLICMRIYDLGKILQNWLRLWFASFPALLIEFIKNT